MRWLVLLAVAGCGRIGFGERGGDDSPPPPDASTPTQFGTDCVLGLRFDEDAWLGLPGEIRDACGGDDNGTLRGGAARADDPVRGRVASFTSTSGDCVTIADAPALRLSSAVTMSAWVAPVALDGTTPFGVIAKRTDDTADVAYAMFLWTANHVFVDIDTEDDELAGVRAVLNGRWTQLTTVYDGSAPKAARVRIYVDGVLDRSGAETAAAITPFASNLAIGCLPQASQNDQQPLRGRLDDVGIWSRAFTDAEVAAWFAATRR